MDFEFEPGPGSITSAYILGGIGALTGGVLGAAALGLQASVAGGVAGGILGWLLGSAFQSDKATNPIRFRPTSLDAKDMARVKSHTIVEIASAVIVILTIFGLVVGIMFPGKITGAIFPLALIMWFILYRVMDQNNN